MGFNDNGVGIKIRVVGLKRPKRVRRNGKIASG
jgi:hypothetical protein